MHLKTIIPQSTIDENQLKTHAQNFAKICTKGDIIFFYGDLGTGKTTFIRQMLQSLTNDKSLTVSSPTFSLMQPYQTKICEVRHYDLYRLSHPEEAFDIGLEDNINDVISLIEWPQIIEPIIDFTFKITLEHNTLENRNLKIEKHC